MDTVICPANEELFYNNKINTCLPRGEKSSLGFTSYSLNEMFLKYLSNELNPNGYYLIDIANGHMIDLLTTTKQKPHRKSAGYRSLTKTTNQKAG